MNSCLNHRTLKVVTKLPKTESKPSATDKEELLTSYEIYRIQLKYVYIKTLYDIILSKDVKFKIIDGCNESINKFHDMN